MLDFLSWSDFQSVLDFLCELLLKNIADLGYFCCVICNIFTGNGRADQFAKRFTRKLFSDIRGDDLFELTLNLGLKCQDSITLRLLGTDCGTLSEN